MLPPQHRLRSSADFARTVRRGRKKGSRTVVVYVYSGGVPPVARDARGGGVGAAGAGGANPGSAHPGAARDAGDTAPRCVVTTGGPRWGLIVSKAVGNAVTRHAVSRKLRHIAAEVLRSPDGDRRLTAETTVVLRALPASATADSEELERDVRTALRAALR
ncbi:ribonuclease P protein component [Corynebacterium bovis]|uniref:ribonuclease P protein component n=1 Tax=Corynebacterium bovis TaxID=36808 RepID=UPI00254F687C|nr:ribonuclease P protein component [Corynebacterium bovis]MDK8511290.1 ribonuclease P protein component [Corynebacterium bovis]